MSAQINSISDIILDAVLNVAAIIINQIPILFYVLSVKQNVMSASANHLE